MQPFTINVPQVVLNRISSRLALGLGGYAPCDDGDWQYGTDASYVGEFVAYWRDGYDWRTAEAALNRWPQFMTEVDGLKVHFIHARSEGPCRLPIILTHGWPGSVLEFQDVIPRLVAGGFDVVVPSLPGYGWSQRPARPIGPRAVSDMWRTLMTDVLGYTRFGAQGGDWGSVVTSQLGINHPDVVAAIHLNLFLARPLRPEETDADVLAFWQRVAAMQQTHGAYQAIQTTKPQTIGLALAQDPVAWAIWVLEKFQGWGDTGGVIETRFSKDWLITNIMTYLVNDAVVSSLWMYYASAQERWSPGPVTVPTGLALYPGEFYPYPSRALAEEQFNVVSWREMASGGHFAALEEPAAFAQDVIDFFGSIV